MLYRIKDWAAHFENNRTKELKNMTWVPMPNKMDGDGYTELLEHPNGAAHFGAWCALVQIASKCDPRGTLLRDGDRPHDPVSLSRISRIHPDTFKEALPRLIAIGWVESQPTENNVVTEMSQEGAATSQEGAPRVRVCARGREWKGREGKGTEEVPRSEERGRADELPDQQASKTTTQARKPRNEPTGHRQCVECFCENWKRKYGEKYPFLDGRDGANVKWILGQLGNDPDRFKAAVTIYFSDDDPFISRDRHSMGLFKSQLRKFITAEPSPTTANGPWKRRNSPELIAAAEGKGAA
jgi:hypothetical protein